MTAQAATHETFHGEEQVVGPSNRSFGLVFAVVFAIIGLFPLWDGRPVRAWALALAAAFAAAAVSVPRVLAPLNRVWLRIGLAMHRVINPVVMAVLFYLAVTPFGLVMRAARAGIVRRLRPDKAVSTYWIDRAGQPASRMDRQF